MDELFEYESNDKISKIRNDIDKILKPQPAVVNTEVQKDRESLMLKISDLKKELNRIKNVSGKHEINKRKSEKRKTIKLKIQQLELDIEDLVIEEEGGNKVSSVIETAEKQIKEEKKNKFGFDDSNIFI